ncbi:RNA polymerase-associated protein RTF1 homolog [Drosophila hydei]|uniref:RNA polymerase-associated protein RTF1 homolog n=1 Tax=Drosophila hydei TaxID=7224 RepID=A0A6J1M4N8_DROHY|nr:RNA polymerase-associated protein RTF1 homolog [Drosophila hydei]
MLGAKPKTRTKSKSKSKHNSPRFYNPTDLVQLMQPLKMPWTVSSDHGRHRPKSEIVRELQRMRHLPMRVDEDAVEVDTEEGVTPASVPIRTLEQLDALRLTRHRIEQLLRCTNFELAVLSCFVRLNVNPMNVPLEYRIAEIMGTTELAEGYYVGKTPTNIVLHLRYEDLVVKHELNDISNMAFTPEEFDYWHDNCICQGIEWPTIELISRKKVELYNALNSEGKLTSILKHTGLMPLAMPMRPVPKGELLERMGGIYPWKLQRPPPPLPSPPPPPPPPLELQPPNSEVREDSEICVKIEPESKELSQALSEAESPAKEEL